MTTTEQLREYLDAHGTDGPPTEPGWYVASLVSHATTAFVLARGGRDRLMFILGVEHGRHFLFPAEIRKHAPLTLAPPASPK